MAMTQAERTALEDLTKAQEKRNLARKEDLRLMGLMKKALEEKDYTEYQRLYPIWQAVAMESIG